MSRKAGIILSAILGIIIALWMWTAIIPKNALSIGGSTSVDPVMQRLTNTYRKNGGTPFVYSSSGSAGGVSNVKSGAYKMGFISKTIPNDGSLPLVDVINKNGIDGIPDSFSNDAKNNGNYIYNYLINKKDFESNNDSLHAVQIAEDAIILTYQAPKSFEQTIGDNFKITFNDGTVSSDSQKIIQSIYSANATWSSIAKDLIKQKLVESSAEIEQLERSSEWNQKIIPFARETGSGTRNTFDNMFGLKGMRDGNGKLIPSRATEFNSNGMMFNSFKINTFGYVSMNYMQAIVDNDNLSTASVESNKKGQDNNSTYVNPKTANNGKGLNIDDIENYKLKRPYIGLFKANLPDSDLRKIADFMGWIATASSNDDSLAYKQFATEGLRPVLKIDANIDSWHKQPKIVQKSFDNNDLISIKITIKNTYIEDKK